MSWSLSAIARARLAGQHLATPDFGAARDVVAWLGAVQAQDYAGAKWGIGQRMVGATDAGVDRSFNAGEIIRTHVLRPTWHFVAPEDLRWLLAATAPRVHLANAFPYRTLGLDAAVLRRSRTALEKSLTGKQLTRDEMREVFSHARIDARDARRFGYLLMAAELDGVICSGARRGKQFTYALLEERVAPVPPVERDDALGRLATRYFRSRGPATMRDFTMWAVLTMKEAARAVDIASADLKHVVIGGTPHWLDTAAPAPARTRGRAHLLPNYDEYFIGFRDRGAFGVAVEEAGVRPNATALFAHILTIDGQIVAGWRRLMSGRAAAVELNPVVPLRPQWSAAISREVRRYAEFLGVPVAMSPRP